MEDSSSEVLDEHSTYDDVRLTADQEKFLAILPIPSALLSVFGSSVIIMMVVQSYKKKKWTPYTRLLVLMSLFDIQGSLTFAAGTFLRPRETSTKLWALGDDATCVTIGFLHTIGFSSFFFQGMLSCYFVLRTKFGFTDDRIAKQVEPIMHVIAIGYPLLSAIMGVSLNLFGELGSGLGCWVTDYGAYSWFVYAIPTFCAILCLTGNSIVLFRFIWEHTRRLTTSGSLLTDSTRTCGKSDRFKVSERTGSTQKNASQFMSTSENQQLDSISDDDDEDEEDSFRDVDKYENTEVTRQRRRMKLLGSQALLFVISYFICNLWTGIMLLQESQAHTDEEKHAMMVKYYSIAMLQAFFHPLQGFCNMMVYVRPKYLTFRYGLPDESRFSVAKLAVFGEDAENRNDDTPSPSRQTARRKIEAPTTMMVNTNKESSPRRNNKRELSDTEVTGGGHNKGSTSIPSSANPLPRNMISSLTLEDLEAVGEEKDSRWGKKDAEIMDTKPRRSDTRFQSSLRSSFQLEVISELSVSIFESVGAPDETDGDDLEAIVEPASPNRPQECRWGTNTTGRRLSDVSPTLAMGLDMSDRTQQASNRFEAQQRRGSIDAPVLAPSRNWSEQELPSDSDDVSTISSFERPVELDMSVRTTQASNRFEAQRRNSLDAPVLAPARKRSELELPSDSDDVSMVSDDNRSVDIPIRPPTRRLSPTPAVSC
ncbi:unnamed protein product [Cylindrotheca closterium]|uniref:G-protein coupled receptors family 2 profile 2 domain-containing protein n=1 Tax=Cylindrotheca closterium TaxID=2856 RepID=A0AAD2CE42_9STRA|nr:unnamed protein product [Cylindrotheca closterium]